MAKKKKHKNDVKTDLPIIMDYGIGSISVYDPADIMPYNEPPISEQIRFKKLGKEMKSEFKWLVSSVVIEYWQENRQIPFGEEMSKLRTRLLRMFAEVISAATGVSSFHHLRYVPVPLEQSASLPP